MELGNAILDTQLKWQGGVKWPGPCSPPPLCTGLHPLRPDSLQTASLSIPLRGYLESSCLFYKVLGFAHQQSLGAKDPFEELMKAPDPFLRKRTYTSSVLHTISDSWLLGKFSAISFYFSFLFWDFLLFTASHHLHIRDRNKIGKNLSPELIILLYEALVSISWTPTFRTYSNTRGNAMKRNNIPQGCGGNKRPG